MPLYLKLLFPFCFVFYSSNYFPLLGTKPRALQRLGKCSLLSHIPTLIIDFNHHTFIYLLCMCVFMSGQVMIHMCVPMHKCECHLPSPTCVMVFLRQGPPSIVTLFVDSCSSWILESTHWDPSGKLEPPPNWRWTWRVSPFVLPETGLEGPA